MRDANLIYEEICALFDDKEKLRRFGALMKEYTDACFEKLKREIIIIDKKE